MVMEGQEASCKSMAAQRREEAVARVDVAGGRPLRTSRLLQLWPGAVLSSQILAILQCDVYEEGEVQGSQSVVRSRDGHSPDTQRNLKRKVKPLTCGARSLVVSHDYLAVVRAFRMILHAPRCEG